MGAILRQWREPTQIGFCVLVLDNVRLTFGRCRTLRAFALPAERKPYPGPLSRAGRCTYTTYSARVRFRRSKPAERAHLR